MSGNFKTVLILGFLLVVLFLGGLYLTVRDINVVRLGNLDQIAANISNRYVDKLDPRQLTQAGIKGMLKELDPYSELLEAKAYYGLLEETSGEFQGLGIEVTVKDNFLTVISTLEGTPAHRAGLMPGDRIIRIDGINAVGISADQAVRKLRGEKGTKVKVTVSRPGSQRPLEFNIVRGVVEIKAVPYFEVLEGKIGYIRLKRFSEKSSQEVAQAITELVPQKISGLILDLRGNPGGLLSEAVNVSGLFLDGKKLIMETRGQDPYQNQKFYSERKALLPDLPLTVLVDGGSASAAEIVAGAIQDWDRGVIIGDTTFGKGMVQSILELEDGLALKLTTAKYFTPSGRCLQRADGQTGSPLASLAGHLEVQPESLTPVEYYTTQAGRKVPGSGGIVPDIIQPGIRISGLEYQLSREGIFFDFAVQYLSANPDIGPEFETSQEVFGHFMNFVNEKNFHYESVSEQELENLTYLAEEEFKSPALKQKLADLDWYIQREEKDIFSRQKEALKWRIKEAILINRFGEKARYERVWLLSHPEIEKAQEILKDRNVYNSILSARSDVSE